MSAVAEAEGLTVSIGNRTVVDGVDLRLCPGRVTALVGASGSGKTTTGLALLGEYPRGARVSGRVHREGPVGYVPQHPAAALNPARRVGALLRDIARMRVRDLPRAERREAAHALLRDALDRAQLPSGEALLRRHPHQLSGGQQQRVVLAQALLLGAPAIVADEPTTGQDTLTKRHVAAHLAALAEEGVAVLLLSHDLDVVRAVADEVAVMREGRVVEAGPVERVWDAPRHGWTRELVGAAGASAAERDGRAGPGAGSSPTPTRQQRLSRVRGAVELPGAEPLLRVREVTARHGRATVLRGAELAVRAGECLAVVGRSGSGKTTLARCVAGLHRTYDGDVLLGGAVLPRSLRRRGRAELAAVQYVFQDARAAFDEFRPVGEQVARTAVRLRGAARGEALAEARSTLARLGLRDGQHRRLPGELSGGELQRAALARALLAHPRVLLCDEITSGLDAVTRRGILDALTSLTAPAHVRPERRAAPAPALVLITHDLDVAALADRVAVLDGGEIVEQGVAAEVLASPGHPCTRALVGRDAAPA